MAIKYMYFLNEEREKLSVLEKLVPALLIFFLLFITFVSNQIIAKQHSVVAVDQDCDYLWTIQENFLEEQRIKLQKELEAAQKKRYVDLTNEDFDKMQHIYSHKDEKIVFLTFDDGPTSNITPQVLDILKAYNDIKINGAEMANDLSGKMYEDNDEMIAAALALSNHALEEKRPFKIGANNLMLNRNITKKVAACTHWIGLIKAGETLPEDAAAM